MPELVTVTVPPTEPSPAKPPTLVVRLTESLEEKARAPAAPPLPPPPPMLSA